LAPAPARPRVDGGTSGGPEGAPSTGDMLAATTLRQLRSVSVSEEELPPLPPAKPSLLVSMLPNWFLSAMGWGDWANTAARQAERAAVVPAKAVNASIFEMRRITPDRKVMQDRVAMLIEEPGVQAAFNKLDLDGSGSVSRDEIGTLLEGLGAALTPDETTRMLAHVDKNGDGVINLVELCTFLLERRDEIELEKDEEWLANEAWSTDLWEVDADGTISVAELKRVFGMSVLPGRPGLSPAELSELLKDFGLQDVPDAVAASPEPEATHRQKRSIGRKKSRTAPSQASAPAPTVKFEPGAGVRSGGERISLETIRRHPAFMMGPEAGGPSNSQR